MRLRWTTRFSFIRSATFAATTSPPSCLRDLFDVLLTLELCHSRKGSIVVDRLVSSANLIQLVCVPHLSPNIASVLNKN